MNKILGFDVSNNSCSVAVSFGENILAYEEDLRSSKQAECLIPMIESVLKKSNLSYKDIDYLALTNGPGSFTGIRIGLAAAKGILLASGIKGLTLTNFDVLYYRAISQIRSFDTAIIIINAYRDQSYIQIFNNLRLPDSPLLVDNRIIPLMISEYGDNKQIICSGSGTPIIFDQIRNFKNVMILPRFSIIKAIHVCRLARLKINNGQTKDSIEPLYIRPPDAKILVNSGK